MKVCMSGQSEEDLSQNDKLGVCDYMYVLNIRKSALYALIIRYRNFFKQKNDQREISK